MWIKLQNDDFLEPKPHITRYIYIMPKVNTVVRINASKIHPADKNCKFFGVYSCESQVTCYSLSLMLL